MNLGSDKLTPLLLAVDKGFAKCVVELVKAGADINRTDCDQYDETAVIKAARKGFPKCLSALLTSDKQRSRVNVNKTDKDGATALIRASARGHSECVDMLVKAKAIVNIAETKRWTALMLAAMEGHTDCVRKLIKAGACVDMVNTNQATALMLAVQKASCVSLLLDAGADVNHVDEAGETASMSAAFFGDIPSLTILLRAGAEVGIVDNVGQNALEIHLSWYLTDACKLLIVAGESTEETTLKQWNRESTEVLVEQVQVPQAVLDFQKEVNGFHVSLQSQCRKFIRRHLVSVSNVNLFHQVERLPLTHVTKAFLLFDVSLDERGKKRASDEGDAAAGGSAAKKAKQSG